MFRAYRESFEEQKLVIEQRFRGLLEESLEDAIHLAAANSQLKLQVQELRQGIKMLYMITYTSTQAGGKGHVTSI